MTDFSSLFAHNSWANGLLLQGLRNAPASFLQQDGRPGAGTNLASLQHMLGVERIFLEAQRGAGFVEPNLPDDLDGLVAYSEATGHEYKEFITNLLDPSQKVYIAWWEREFTVEGCFFQVIGHSWQHRAELAWELARAGVDTGEMDYIRWLSRNTA
ncbi:MAG: DinB family protein [Dehalococcoidia bacterium]|nr:hypothetical protein [Dehalococcoidia bacterium]